MNYYIWIRKYEAGVSAILLDERIKTENPDQYKEYAEQGWALKMKFFALTPERAEHVFDRVAVYTPNT